MKYVKISLSDAYRWVLYLKYVKMAMCINDLSEVVWMKGFREKFRIQVKVQIKLSII